MKTKRKFIEERLPEDLAKKVISHADKTIDDECESFSVAMSVFWWHKTPEGYKFWANICNQYR